MGKTATPRFRGSGGAGAWGGVVSAIADFINDRVLSCDLMMNHSASRCFDGGINRLVRYGLWTLSTSIFLLTLNAQTASWEDRLVGKWKMNIAKSQFQSMPRPIESAMTISQATASRFKLQVVSTFPGGKTSFMGFDGAIDGKPHDYQGTQGAKLSFVDNNGVLEGTATYPGGMTMHETITISQDSNTISSESNLAFPKGTASWTEVWERVQQKKK
jgi:hypothetical protein